MDIFCNLNKEREEIITNIKLLCRQYRKAAEFQSKKDIYTKLVALRIQLSRGDDKLFDLNSVSAFPSKDANINFHN